MQINNYLILLFTSLFLAGTIAYYYYARAKGMVFRYKPITLLIVLALFLLSLYAVIINKPYNEILPFIR
jgi:hypothetical protein